MIYNTDVYKAVLHLIILKAMTNPIVRCFNIISADPHPLLKNVISHALLIFHF